MTETAPSNNLAYLLARSARCYPQLSALARGVRPHFSYRELVARVAALAAGIARRGYRPGERVAIAARNNIAYVEALFAIWHAGLCAVPVNAKLHADELAYIFEHAGARLAFVDEDSAAVLASAGCTLVSFGGVEYETWLSDDSLDMVGVVPDAPAWLFYTSGTTGKPKGVVLTHANLLAMSLCFLADVESVAPGDA